MSEIERVVHIGWAVRDEPLERWEGPSVSSSFFDPPDHLFSHEEARDLAEDMGCAMWTVIATPPGYVEALTAERDERRTTDEHRGLSAMNAALVSMRDGAEPDGHLIRQWPGIGWVASLTADRDRLREALERSEDELNRGLRRLRSAGHRCDYRALAEATLQRLRALNPNEDPS